MKVFRALLKSEILLQLRGLDTVIFGVAIPIVITVVIGAIMGNKPAFEGADYTFMQQSFGAFSAIGICACGLMGLPLTLADYRDKKVLKRFQVTPVSPVLLLFVQFIMNFVIAIISALGVFLVSALFFQFKFIGSWGSFIMSYLLVLISIFSLGMMLASVAPNVKTANLLCTVLYFPMLLFSGATIPYEIMPRIMQKIMDVMPLTQGIKLLKASSLGLDMKNVTISIIVMVGIAVISILLSLKFFRWE